MLMYQYIIYYGLKTVKRVITLWRIDGWLFIFIYNGSALILNATVKCLFYLLKLRRMVIKARSMSLFIAHEYANKMPMHSAFLIWPNSLSAMRTRFSDQCSPDISNGYCSFWWCIFLCHCVLCPVKLCHRMNRGMVTSLRPAQFLMLVESIQPDDLRLNIMGLRPASVQFSLRKLSVTRRIVLLDHSFLRRSICSCTVHYYNTQLFSARNSVYSSTVRTGKKLCYLFY